MDLSNDLISKFVKITNDDKNKNSESTVYGTVVEYNGGMYVRIDGSDLLTPVETTADFKPNERVTVMIKNHSATVTGNITSPATNEGAVTEKVTEAVEEVEGKVITEVEILIADRVSTKQLDAEVARIDELIAGKASVEDLTATNAEITNLKADKASIKDLTATNAEITNLKAEDAKIENLLAGKASVEDLTATNAEIINLKAKDAEIENLVADKARIEDLTATNARIDSLQANKADITYLDANFATIDELEAAHADIEILDAEVANINTLVNGNLTSDNILSLNITSQNTTMENAFVKDAMIDTVTANKIMSGTIDTNNVTIQSTDGSMLLQGTLLQMKDDNGKVRIQIGKDTGGNFTFILYDESGTGVLIDEEGIKSSDAIADGLIVDAKVADNANIAGSKLNIASVITEVNKDNSTTIKSNKIYLDEQGQSLEVAFNSLKTHVDTIQDVTIDGDLTEVIEQVQSNTTQIAANKEGISTLVSENTIRKEEIQNLDGEIESVNSTLSSKYSSLEQDVSGFKSTVADTYTTKSEFNNLQIGGVNLVPWSECIELDSSDNGNIDNSIIENNTVKITPMNDGNAWNNTIYTSETRLQGETYTLSFDILSPDDIGFYWYPSETYYIDYKIKASSKWQTVSFTYTQRGETTAGPALFGFYMLIAGHVYYYRRLKLEKGNKPTAWSPAPQDIQGQIDATNNNLTNNYSTTTQMNSAIQQKANEITSSVSETYTTKSEFNNLEIGGRNLATLSNIREYAGGGLYDNRCYSVEGTKIIAKNQPLNASLIGFKIYADNTFEYTVSGYTDTSLIYVFFKCYDKNNTIIQDQTFHTKTVVDGKFISSFNNIPKDTYYFNIGVGNVDASNYFIDKLKIEKGNKATDWSPAPEDVQGQIDATNNNLSANYSTTSAMNSAIQQKANEITSSVSETYTTKAEFNNLEIGGTNLLPKSGNFKDNFGLWVTNGSTMTLETVVTYNGYNTIKIDNNSSEGIIYSEYITLKPNTTYTYSITAVGAGIVNAGINTPLHMWVYPQGNPGNFHYEEIIDWSHTGIGTKWGRSYVVFKTPDVDDICLMKPFIFQTEGQIIYVANFKVEEGNRPTDWSPAPEDVQGQIDATNNNLANNYSTTTQMNSAIQQKANEITSTVSETYTTKSEFNSLQIGGKNLLLNSKRETTNNEYCIDEFRPTELFEVGEQYTVSICVTPANGVDYILPFISRGYNTLSNGLVVNGATKQVLSITFTFNGYASDRVPVDINDSNAYVQFYRFPNDGTVTGNTTLHWVKVEKGAKATDWSPAPEDVQGQIDATNDNLQNNYSTTSAMNSAIQQKANEITSSVSQTYATKQSVTDINNNLTNNYSTTSQMNSAIQQKANEITSSVSQTYATKQSVTDINNNLTNNYSTTSAMNSAIQQKANEITSSVSQTYATKQSVTDINNNLTNNYSTTSQMNSAIQQKANEITSSVSQTYISNYEAKKLADTTTTGLKKYLFERYQRDGFDYGARPTLNDLVGARLIESRLVDYPPPYTSDLGDNYIGVLTFYLYYDYACTKSVEIATDDNGTVYLNNVAIYELNTCQPANVTFNMIKGLNRIDIVYAEGGGGDGVSWAGVDGWSAFGAYVNVVTNEIANRTNELTLAMTQGNMLYTDPTFRNGENGTFAYNNLGNDTVTKERIVAIEGCPNTSGYCLKITTNGEATPGLGGFAFGNNCRYNAVFITKITAKIPVGYRIVFASNHYGDNGEQKWLSSTEGTGDWYDYYCKLKCGDYGSIANTNYFYLDGPLASAENPVTWYVSYATVFDVTDSDERITNLTNNLAVNYSTTSQMNSAIQQKANEITSSVSQTYTTKSETTAIQNQITTSRNLLMGSRDYNLGKWGTERATILDEWYNGTRIYTTSSEWASMDYYVSDLIDRGVIELFTPYTFSCYVMSTGSDYTPNIHFYGDGLPNYHGAFCGTATTSWQRMSITIEWSSLADRSYGIRFEAPTASPSGSHLRWACFQLERGKVATGWGPAPEDAQYAINDVNNNLVANYATTSSMNSAIQQKANEITSSVSQTYTTKAEFNNLEVGGTNLIYNGGFNRNLDSWNANGNSNGVQACGESPSGYMLCIDATNHGNGVYQMLRFHDSTYCTDYVVSFYAKTNVSGSQMYVSVEGDPGTSSVFTLNEGWQKCVYKFRRYNPGVNAIVFYASGAGTRNIYIHSIKMEKGTVPSAWSPHPSEIENKVNDLSNNLTNNYSTTSQMNSAIQQKANEITSSVSQTYATKQSVTDVNNNLVNNYSTTSQMNSAIQQKANEITSSVSQTYTTKSETSLINDTVAGNRKWLFEQYTNNQNVGTGNGTYPTLAHLANETLTSSRLVDSLPGSASELGSSYLGVYTVYLYYESAYTWSGSIMSDDESTTYLNGVAVCQAPTCISTPFTMNFKKGINKLQIIHGEGGGSDGVTLSDLGPWKEYGAYPACVTAASSNHYASNSDIVQTANDLTIKFTESGGYNLLQNGHADKGTSYWNNNGGGLAYHQNAGGGATGNFFGTSFPHGMVYYDWVRLLPNTHYVYQAKVFSDVAFTGHGSVPLHFWFSWDGVNGTGDGYTILDYQQNVSTTNTWIQCYVHFVTGSANIYFKPFIYSGDTVPTFFVTELMLSQSRVVQPWSPHPSEVYSGITQIDKDGIKVQHSNVNGYTHMSPDGFFINRNGADVLSATSNGLYVQGNITSGSTIQGARITGSTFNSSNDVFQVLEDGSIETSFLAVNGAVSTDKLNVNDIENASYPKVLTEATTVYISPNGGVNAEEFYDGAYFTSLSNMLAVAPRNLNGYTLTIRMAGDLYENAALTWFHSGQVNFEMQGYTLYGYFYGYGASMCYRLYGNTNANNNGTWGHIKPNVGRAMGSYYYAVQFQYCQFAVNYVAVYPSASSGSSSGGIGVHRGATGIIFNAKACGDMRYLVRAEYAGRVHVNSTQGACNNATFCALTGGIITLNSSNNQAGRSTTGNPYWVGSGGLILCDQLLGMDKITFNNTSQSGSSSSSGSTTRKVTETIKASSADTYRSTVYNNWKGDGTVRQGDYGYGDCQGCWFFGNNLYTTMNAGTVTKVVIRIKRQSGGVNALQTLTVKSHNHTSRPSGAPTYTDTIGTCSCAVGSYIDLVITDSTTINKLKKCKGLGLSIGSASSPYAVCSGACSVFITYTTNS